MGRSGVLEIAYIVIVLSQVVLVPYTKVEESPPLQAVHDILEYGIQDISKYDHFESPHPVPRSFVGPLALAALTAPFHYISRYIWSLSLFYSQIYARLVLGLLNAIQLIRFSRRLGRRQRLFLLISCTQFNYNYWTSRTIPNTFANVLVLSALRSWLFPGSSLEAAITKLVFAASVIRSEVAVLLMVILMIEAVQVWKNFLHFAWVGLRTLTTSIALSMALDSYFWDTPWLWPEWQAFYYNVIVGHSSNWGSSPWFTYFVNFLPKHLLAATLPAVVGMIFNEAPNRTGAAALGYVLVMSVLPHKESRFILYTVPLWNSVAVGGIAKCKQWFVKHRGSYTSTTFNALVGMILLGNSFYTISAITASGWNYPGGHALAKIHELVNPAVPVAIHIDTLTAMTGASKFGELNRPVWKYSKRTDIQKWDQFDYLLTEEMPIPAAFESLEKIDTFAGVDYKLATFHFRHGLTIARKKGVMAE